MYMIVIDETIVDRALTFRDARKIAEHISLDNKLNDLGYKSVGFVTPDLVMYEVAA